MALFRGGTIRGGTIRGITVEIMSSPLVTFNFKTFPKDRSSQFLNLLAQTQETHGRRQVVTIALDKTHQMFSIFPHTNHTFLVRN